MPPFGKRVGLKHLRPAFAHPPSPVSNDTVHNVNVSPDDGGNAHVHGSKNKQQELSDNNFGESDKENEPPSTSSPLNASAAKRPCIANETTEMHMQHYQQERSPLPTPDELHQKGIEDGFSSDGIDDDRLLQVTDVQV
jgi:hypothetical protein